jgi:hypothetical protein
MTINNLILAAICNDLKHATKYSVDDEGNCYYKCELVGKIKEEFEQKDGEIYHHIWFQPVKAIEYITVNFTITPSGADCKE